MSSLEIREAVVPNQAGNFHSFNYQDANATNWSASLQDLQPQSTGGENDPDFEHIGPAPANNNNHQDQVINYITGNGSKWTSICQSHSMAPTTFTFQHFQFGSTNLDHESDRLEVIDWDGSIWEITVPLMQLDHGPITLNLAPGPAGGTAPPVLEPGRGIPQPYSPPRDV
jgi:hypothetical protein